jgi:hypothetical protein
LNGSKKFWIEITDAARPAFRAPPTPALKCDTTDQLPGAISSKAYDTRPEGASAPGFATVKVALPGAAWSTGIGVVKKPRALLTTLKLTAVVPLVLPPMLRRSARCEALF